jgi:hypothetical protein
MSTIRSIYDCPGLYGSLTKCDFLLGLMDRMGPQALSLAYMGFGNDNFSNIYYHDFENYLNPP